MDECFRCGISGEKVKLYDVISNRGVVKMCENCATLEKLPIIRKPTDNQITEAQRPRQTSIRDRLTGMSRGMLAGRETSLRELVDRNIKSKQIQSHPDLIDNFHWTIQRIRRNRKITREEFAKGIGESEATVRMIEQGILPDNNYTILNKVEGYLRVSLRKSGVTGFPNTDMGEKRYILDNSLISKEEQAKKLSFDAETVKRLKIADLKSMKKKEEEEKKPVDSWEEEYSEDDEKFLDNPDENEDLFDEEDED